MQHASGDGWWRRSGDVAGPGQLALRADNRPGGLLLYYRSGDKWFNQRPGPPGTHLTTIPGPGSEKAPEGRWRPYTLDEILARDKVSLDLFWLRDESLEDSANLPDPHILAEEIADDLRSALEQIESVLGDLPSRSNEHRAASENPAN